MKLFAGIGNATSQLSLPPTILVLFSIASMQVGAAFAKSLFPEVGPAGMVLMRVGFAAITLFFLCRPAWRFHTRHEIINLLSFGVVLSLMNLSFYAAIERIPVGIAATLEFIGPLGLATLKSRKKLDALWIVLAFAGILLLAPIRGDGLDIIGVFFALLAAIFWALYILLSAESGRAFPGVDGLCWAMIIAAFILSPIGIYSAGSTLLNPKVLMLGFAVAMLSSMIPYTLELIALKSLPVHVFGILKSLEPMAGAVAGLLILGETLTVQAVLAIILVSLAAAGASRFREE
ncbi:MAG: EamA family transporter [Shackletoniella antarctica]|jgi:inner membrane transporter RhtA|uniref:EamA family transporter n=1 Tax=Shackletoniella antarctica TaxID=268115 RepID=A0A2W4WDK6_9CYAN|nr:MAG: EamA family transporter [Shackletoniella antarctica]